MVDRPDFYDSILECEKNKYVQGPENPRYSNFKQLYFTAGDDEQFKRLFFRDNPLIFEKEVYEHDLPEQYRNLCSQDVLNTFYYIYDKFKKGIFIRIYNNELTFLPFSKKNFINEWSKLIAIKPGFFKYLSSLDSREFDSKKFNNFIENWYANNCLVRYEYPISENDTNHALYADLFKTLLKNRTIPNVEFFLNRRDFPILKSNKTEAYTDLFGENVPLLSHSYDKYCPILSMVKQNGYLDIPIPTCDDWTRICAQESKYFVDSLKLYSSTYKFDTPWAEKKQMAVFRGSSTGRGVDEKTNMRLKISKMRYPLLDAGITRWNLRPRKLADSPFLQTIDDKFISSYKLKAPLSHLEQSKYKYIINIDGHVSAFRLSLEMSMGSVILLVQSEYSLWFEHLMKPGFHYIPIKADLSDLIEKIEWCANNDRICEQIAKNSVQFYHTYLTKDGVLDYLQQLMYKISNACCNYRHIKDIKKVHMRYKSPYVCMRDSIIDKTDWAFCLAMRKMRIDESLLTQRKIIFNNHNTTVTQCVLNNPLNLSIIEKKNNNYDEFVRDLYYSRRISKLRRVCKGFVYCYGYLYKNETLKAIYLEHIPGITFLEYLNKHFIFEEYICILFHLCRNIHIMQTQLQMAHNDLTPWNIIIMPNKYPVIIDFGKSVHLSKSTTIQDVLSILMNSLSIIIENKEHYKKDGERLLYIANFMSNTTYRRTPFTERGELLKFINSSKKYGDFVRSNKFELSHKKPNDFIRYLSERFNEGEGGVEGKNGGLNTTPAQVFKEITGVINAELPEVA